ncbi:uncharacterized protein [Malus domestica]|uniref:uncharacterized protein n=1 Tax=Malus domestica TaxID=3750 RepID=UPI00397648E1
MAGVSLNCGDCGTLLRSVEEAQEHAELSSHSNFSESTEAVLNLVCSSCGKPRRSKTESDLHTKRTGRTEFVDKTADAAKPISLEVPKATPSGSKEAVCASSHVPEEMVVPEVDKKLLEELEGMGFSTPRATRALHHSEKPDVNQNAIMRQRLREKGVEQDLGRLVATLKMGVRLADIHLSQTLRKAGALCTGYDLLGNASLEVAVNWVVEHENDPDIDEMPSV